jgi:hypothetical protein
MKAFNDFYKDYAKEKEHPIDRNSLDPAVWEFPDNNLPLLHPMIKTQILQDVQYINKIINVVEFYMVNKILTNEYTASTKIDVYVQINEEQLTDILMEQINNLLKEINGRLATGTTHPIYYFITQNDETKDKFKVSYDIGGERWHRSYIKESIVDYAHNTLDTELWDIKQQPPKIKPEVKDKIMGSLKDHFSDNFFKNYIDEVHITGSIATKQWKHDTDIDVHIIPKDIEKYKSQYEQLRSKTMKEFRQKKILINDHPIEVYIQTDPAQETRGDASYNLTNDKWIKMPFELSNNFDPDIEFSYIKKDLTHIFKGMDSALGELRRDLIDYNLIKDYLGNLKSEEKQWLNDKLEGKMNEIESDIEHLVTQKNKYHSLRKEIYSTDDIEDAWKDVIHSKSWAPSNVIWKMLDRYKYISLIVSLQEILKDSDGEIDQKDINDIEDVISFEQYINLDENDLIDEKKHKGGKFSALHADPINPNKSARAGGYTAWRDPLKSYKYLATRGISRKKLGFIPKMYLPGETLPTAQGILDVAKNAEQGIWKISIRKAKEIGAKYHLRLPTKFTYRNHRSLGKTRIHLWYNKRNGNYYLVKDKRLQKRN